MPSRLYCWRKGHTWGRWDARVWEDLFGNEWRVRWCSQCGARDRRLA